MNVLDCDAWSSPNPLLLPPLLRLPQEEHAQEQTPSSGHPAGKASSSRGDQAIPAARPPKVASMVPSGLRNRRGDEWDHGHAAPPPPPPPAPGAAPPLLVVPIEDCPPPIAPASSPPWSSCCAGASYCCRRHVFKQARLDSATRTLASCRRSQYVSSPCSFRIKRLTKYSTRPDCSHASSTDSGASRQPNQFCTIAAAWEASVPTWLSKTPPLRRDSTSKRPMDTPPATCTDRR